MKILKNLLMSIGILALIFLVITVSINFLNERENKKAIGTIDNAFLALKEYNLDEMSKYVTTEKIEQETEKILNTSKGVKESTDAEKAIFKHIEYEIIEPAPITIFDKERLVDVKLSNKNMGEVLVKYFTDSVTFSFTNAFSDNKLQNEALDAKYQELFVNAIDSESVKLTESTINLKLVKQEDKTWKIEFLNEDQFINAILPSFKETLANYLTEKDLTSGLSSIMGGEASTTDTNANANTSVE